MKIILSSGVTLEPTTEQMDAIRAYLAHESTQVPVWDEAQQRMVTRPRWATADDWIMYHWRELMKSVLATVPPPAVAAIDQQIAALQSQRAQVMMPIVTPPAPREREQEPEPQP